MKKKSIFFLAFLICLIFMTGCNGKDGGAKETVLNETEGTVTPSAGITEPAITEPADIPKTETKFYAGLSEDEIKEKSIDYTGGLTKGKFKETADSFSEVMLSYIDEASLETIWKSSVLLFGEFKGIEKDMTQVNLVDGYAVCLVFVRYEMNGLQVSFTYNKDLEIDGFYLNAYTPQDMVTPAPQDNTDEREIEITLGEGQYPLSGILTLPKNVPNPPVVILIQGSGQSDMDETIGIAGNKPFRDIARGLADQGIATIRYNKRYYQYPNLAEVTSTIYDEVLNDVQLAVDYVRSNTQVDSSRIFVAGHSLGGMMAPKVVQMEPEIAGMISLAGSPRRLEDIIYDQARIPLEKLGLYTEEEIEGLMADVTAMVEKIKHIEQYDLNDPVFGATGYYWKSINEINTQELVQKVKVPMLFLQGDVDFQVYPEVDFALWKEILKDNPNAAFKLYEGINHLFMKTNGLDNVLDYDIEAKVEQCVIDDIASWILTGELKE